MSDKLNQTQGFNLSRDTETEGFDLQAGETWIYPTNYPVREYQFNITQKALHKNTLVSLPTGLGKTFIAAVVMFNYFRWYPLGKVVFMAPTRPLVKQQIDACYDIMGIPQDSTVEITGTKLSNTREEIWKEKRVFFVTPQILQNDLDKFENLGPKIKCLVFDEAHRAKGNHAYCEVIRKLVNTNKYFRVLALSATPGGSINDVFEIVQNLLISHLEFRTEESLDVKPYVFQRNLTTVVVPLEDKLQEVRDNYMKVLEYHTRTLIKYKVVQGNCANLTKGKVFMLMKHYQAQSKGNNSNYAEIMKSLNICITLYHAAELLTRHGLRSFLNFFQEHIEKPLFRNNTDIRAILSDIRDYIGPLPELQQLPDGEYPEIPKDVKFGHPKFYKLRDILLDHFKEIGDSSRAIVFFEYRDSVMEACMLLIQSKPILRPRIFVGQKQGVTQRSQINVVKAFREGRCNVLLSTSIGEEGLDVGEVDLIVCFDISNKSPIRMVQRMGRTGRKKDGNVVVLVTEGKEQQTLKDCLIHKNNVAFHVLGSKELAKGLITEYPRLIPQGLVPRCEKIFITVKKGKEESKKDGNLKRMLRSLSDRSSEPTFSPNLEIVDVVEKIPVPELYSTKEDPFDENLPLPNLFSKRIEKIRSFQETDQIEHSSNCDILVGLLQMAESRRFNIPMSQINKSAPNKNLKQTDIRNMFFKSQSAKDFITPFTPVSSNPVQATVVEDKNVVDQELFEEIELFLNIQKDTPKQCRLCPSHFNCKKTNLSKKPSTKTVLNWVELDASVYLNITEQDLEVFKKDITSSECQSFQFEDSINFQLPDTPISSGKESKVLELEDLVDNSILGDFCNKTTNFQAPKSLTNLLNRYSVSLIDEEVLETNLDRTKNKIDNRKEHKVFSEEEILKFFKLNSLDGLFDVVFPDSQRTVIYSPDMFDETLKTREEDEEVSNSPILCSYVNKKRPKISKMTQKVESKEKATSLMLDDLFDFSFFDSSSTKKDNTVLMGEKIISMTDSCSTNDFCEESSTNDSKKRTSCEKETKSKAELDISDFFDEELIKSPTIFNKNNPEGSKIINGSINQQKVTGNEELIKSPTIFNKNNPGGSKIINGSINQQKVTGNDVNDKDTNIEDDLEDQFANYLNGGEVKTKAEVPRQNKESNCIKSVSQRLDFSDFNLEDVFIAPESKKVAKTPKKNEKRLNSSPSQLSVTQMVSLVNKTTQQKDEFEFDDSFNFTKKVAKTPKKNEKRLNSSPSQLSVTQMVSLVNKNTQQKDEFEFDDSFNFTFNTRKPSKSSSSEKSSTKSKETPKRVHNSSSDKSKLDNSTVNSCKKLNFSVNASNSDDDFETKPKSPVWIRKKRIAKKKIQKKDSLDEFNTARTSPVLEKPKIRKKTKNFASAAGSSKNKKVVNPFIDDEAELSICDEIVISDDENDILSQDGYEESFVADNTINVDTQMHAVYLNSVKNVHCQNKFKIPMRFKHNANVFSQQVEEEEEGLDDSFVVSDEVIESGEELSQLEILEKLLEARKKRKKKLVYDKKPTKRKRIIADSDSD